MHLPEDDDFHMEDVVAVLRLPLPVGGLPKLSADLETMYGPSLRMVCRGRFLIVLSTALLATEGATHATSMM